MKKLGEVELTITGIYHFKTKAMRIKFNDKIYRLKEIESGVDSLMELVEEPRYKDGDFLHSDWENENITIIYRKINGSYLYYHVGKSNRFGLCFDKERVWLDDRDFRLATESEKKELIDALAEVGKRWNADKKCVEDWLEPWSDEPKIGDWVIAWNNDMSLAVIGIKIDANPAQGFKHVLNNNNSYKHAIKFDGTVEQFEKVRKG